MPVAEELIPVPVPRSLLADVHELIVKHERALEEEADEADSALVDEALIRRMYRESEDPLRRLMKLLAAHAGERMYTSRVAEELVELEHGSRSAAGMFGAFGRRAAHRYGGNKPWIEDWDPAAHEPWHLMPEEIARVIRSL